MDANEIIVPWPTELPPHFNGQQCDMLVGPCACGAWHTYDEPHVRAAMLELMDSPPQHYYVRELFGC